MPDDLTNLKDELKAGGYDGLYCTEERCGCGLDDLVCCGMQIDGDEGIHDICKPAYRHDCLGDECADPCDGQFYPGGNCFGASKDGPKRREQPPTSDLTTRIASNSGGRAAMREYAEHRSLVGCETEHGLRICIRKADAAILELLEALELRDKMLRLAWEDAYPMHGDTYDSGGIYKRWLADLRERAERGT